jgi:hypothetical protein
MNLNRIKLSSLAVACALLAATGCSSTSADAPAPAVEAAAAAGANFSDYFDNYSNGENALDIITGGYPDSIGGCVGMGYNPIFVINTTQSPQTFTYTINSELANEVIVGSDIDMTDITCTGSESVNNGEVTLQSGESWTGGVVGGGSQGPDTDLTGSQHNLAIGGGDNGQWYDFWLNEDANQSFNHWELNYSGTGGSDPTQNLQAGLFNVMVCSPTTGSAGTEFTVTNQLASPYDTNAANAWQYNNNDPICFAFFDMGAPVVGG